MKKIIPTFIILVFFAGIYLFLNKTIAGRILFFGVKMDVQGLSLKDVYSNVEGNTKVDWIEASGGGETLFLGKSNPENSSKFIDDKIYSLMALFDPSMSPYPGAITNTIDCSSEFKPVLVNSKIGKIYQLSAGERFGYGVCAKDLIKYNSLYGLFDCGKKGVFEIKIFGDPEDASINSKMLSFTCN
jgi:hypothetical protein